MGGSGGGVLLEVMAAVDPRKTLASIFVLQTGRLRPAFEEWPWTIQNWWRRVPF